MSLAIYILVGDLRAAGDIRYFEGAGQNQLITMSPIKVTVLDNDGVGPLYRSCQRP